MSVGGWDEMPERINDQSFADDAYNELRNNIQHFFDTFDESHFAYTGLHRHVVPDEGFKAFGTFNGSLQIVRNGSKNIAKVVKVTTGIYQVFFSAALDVPFMCQATAQSGKARYVVVSNQKTNSVELILQNNATGNVEDLETDNYISLAVFNGV